MPLPDIEALTPSTSLVMRGAHWVINRRDARRLKLEVSVYEPSHWSRLRVLNAAERPIIVHATDWCIGKKRNRRAFGSVVWDQEILPDSTLDIDFLPYGVFRDNVWRFSEGRDIQTLRFRIHTGTGLIRVFHPSEKLIGCLSHRS